MPYESNYIPTPIEAMGEVLLVPSGLGVVYSINNDGSGLVWEHKVSNSSVTSICPVNEKNVIITTMDGTIVMLKDTKSNLK